MIKSRVLFRFISIFVAFRLTLLGVNLGFFENVPSVGVFFSTLNTLLVYALLVPFIVLATRLLPVEKFSIKLLLPIHVLFALIYTVLFEGLIYAMIAGFAPNADDLITDVFQLLHWKAIDHISSYGMIVFICYTYVYYSTLTRERELQAKLRDQLKQAHLDALKYQLNPHFLFNSLNSINALILDDANKAQQMLIGLSDFLRFSLHVRDQRLIPLETELEQLERYLDIEKIRFSDRLNVKLNNAAPTGAGIPTLLLQPLVENAIKHAVAKTSEVTQISLNCIATGKRVALELKNTLFAKSETSGEGVGLQNVRDRLRANFGDDFMLSISQENDFTVRIEFPLVEAE